MNFMNKTGKIKIAILAFALIVNIIKPSKASVHQNLMFFVIAFISGTFLIPFIVGVNSNFVKYDLSEPLFNDNPLTLKRILSPVYFFALLLLAGGSGIIIGTSIKYHSLNNFGLTTILYGVGFLIGIKLTLIWIKPRVSNHSRKH
jgi:hypothetical protein